MGRASRGVCGSTSPRSTGELGPLERWDPRTRIRQLVPSHTRGRRSNGAGGGGCGTFIVHTNHAAAVAEALARFNQLSDAGFTAAVRTGQGSSQLVRHFDPDADETVFFPRLRGG